jgi:hypothetical protein
MIERMFREPKLLSNSDSKTRFGSLKNYKHSQSLNAVALHHKETPEASKHYPIFFVKDSDGSFTPVAILGLEDKSNLFVDKSGEWSRGKYVPSVIRLYPFSLSKTAENQVSIAYDSAYDAINHKDGFTIFDESGEQTESGKKVVEFAEQNFRLSNETKRSLKSVEEVGLFRSINIDIGESESRKFVLKGFYQIDVEKLNSLSDEDLLKITKSGGLHTIYNHLDSIPNFSNLLNRVS